jgi:hypothetical protein
MDDYGCENHHDCILVFLFSWYGLPWYPIAHKYNITFIYLVTIHSTIVASLVAFNICVKKKSLSQLCVYSLFSM